MAIAVGVLVAVLLYIIACVAGGSYGTAFFAIPFFVGAPVGAIYPRRPYAMSLTALGITLLIALVTSREGVVCMLFALPIVVPLLIFGAFVGSTLVRHVRRPRDRHGLMGLLLFLGGSWQAEASLRDEPLEHPLHSARASVLVDAPPEDVFRTLTERPLRLAPRWPWFLRLGLPVPERMAVERPGPDGRLRFEFSQGTAYAKVTAWDAPHELSYAVTRYEIHDLPFHITRLGKSPDYGFKRERVQDWLTIESTRYTLRPVDGNKTLLERSIVWRRHLAPDLYFGWLQQAFIERGQVRLLELIREQVPRQTRPPSVKTSAL